MWNIKSSNRILDLKQKQEAHMRHLRALQNIKPSINIKQPKRYTFLEYKAKALQKAKCNTGFSFRKKWRDRATQQYACQKNDHYA